MLVYLARLETILNELTYWDIHEKEKTNMMVHIIGYYRFLKDGIHCKNENKTNEENLRAFA